MRIVSKLADILWMRPMVGTNPSWGKNLKREVMARYPSLRAAAAALGVKQTTFSAWCRGRWPGEEQAKQIARKLSVDYAALISSDSGRPDDGLMEIAIKVVDDVSNKALIPLTAEAKAKLTRLAYDRLQLGSKPWEIPSFLDDLLSLIKLGSS